MKLTALFKISAMAMALVAGAGGAYSATLAVDSTFPSLDPLRGDVTCTNDACSGLVDKDNQTFSLTNALLYDLPNASTATELAFVNTATGSSFLSGAKTSGNSGSMTFTTDALFILLKIGRDPNTTIIQNTFGKGLEISWSAFSGQGAGLSHYTEYGTASVVPLPAAGWLMLAALGGLGLIGRRRRTI